MFIVTMSYATSENGELEASVIQKLFSTRDAAQNAMEELYFRELDGRHLLNNNACDESGEACPGGYIIDGEAEIYEYQDYAFGQLLPCVLFTVQEI